MFATALGGLPVLRVIVTHMHPDHIGCAALAVRALERAPLDQRDRLRHRPDGDAARAPASAAPLSAAFMARTAWPPIRERSTASRARTNYYKQPGARGARVVPAPARRQRSRSAAARRAPTGPATPAMATRPSTSRSIARRARVLISGDMVLPRISTNVSVVDVEPEADPLTLYLDSIERMRAIDRRRARPALARPAVQGPAHAHRPAAGAPRRAFRRDARGLRRSGPQSAFELVPVMFKRPLDLHQMTFAMGESIAHLHALWLRRQARALDRRGRRLPLRGRSDSRVSFGAALRCRKRGARLAVVGHHRSHDSARSGGCGSSRAGARARARRRSRSSRADAGSAASAAGPRRWRWRCPSASSPTKATAARTRTPSRSAKCAVRARRTRGAPRAAASSARRRGSALRPHRAAGRRAGARMAPRRSSPTSAAWRGAEPPSPGARVTGRPDLPVAPRYCDRRAVAPHDPLAACSALPLACSASRARIQPPLLVHRGVDVAQRHPLRRAHRQALARRRRSRCCAGARASAGRRRAGRRAPSSRVGARMAQQRVGRPPRLCGFGHGGVSSRVEQADAAAHRRCRPRGRARSSTAHRYASGSRRRISASIQVSTSRISSSALAPGWSDRLADRDVDHARPQHEALARPAARRRHGDRHAPAAPVSTASRVPPLLYVPWPPRGVRVPSGNMITQLPCAM